MKTQSFVTTLFIGTAFLIFSGCQKAPQAEIDMANAAVESARSVEANKYLAAEFIAIQDSLNAAMASIEEQNSKSALGRNYDEARRILGIVTQMAQDAVTKTDARKEELKIQNEALSAELQTLIQENKALILKAPKGKEGKAALDLISQDMAVIETTVNDAAALTANGDILSENDKLNAAKEKAVAINDELKTAIAKATKR